MLHFVFAVHSINHDLQYPSLLVVLSAHRSENVLKEARKVGVPVLGIVDTTTDINSVDVLILANDDGLATTQWLLQTLKC